MLAFEEEKTNKKREEDERRPADADTATAADGVSVDPKYLDPEAWLDAQPDINNSLEFDVEDESHRSVRGIGEGRATRRPKVGSDGVALGRASRDLVGTTRKVGWLPLLCLGGAGGEGGLKHSQARKYANNHQLKWLAAQSI